MKVRFVVVLIMGMMLAMPAVAKGKGNKGGGKGRGGQAVWSERDRSIWGFGVRDDRPHGWSQGRKTGWGDCDVPPGQAKKHGCRGWFGTRRGQRDVYGFGRSERDRGAVIIPVPESHPEARPVPRPDGTLSRMPRPPRPTADGRPRPRTE